MIKRRLAAAALCTGIFCAAAGARGQVLAERVPSDAVMYAGWAGVDALGPAYNTSHLKAFLEAFNLPQLVADRLKSEMDKQADPKKVQEGRDFLASLAQSPSAFFMGPFDTSGEQPQPRVALFSRVGKERAVAMAALVQEGLKRNPENNNLEVVAAGEFLLVQTKNIDLRDRLAGAVPADNLASQETFKKALARVGPDASKAAIVGYVDGPGLLDTVNEAAKKAPDPQKILPAVVTGSGLASLRQVVWTGNFVGADWQSATFVGMRDRRNGLLAFLDHPPLTEGALKLIPKNAVEAGVARFDGMRLMKDVTDAAGAFNENAPKQIEQVITEVYKFTGIDIKRDLLPALGDEFVYYAAAQPGSNSVRGLTLVNRLRDPVKGQTAADNVENFVNLLILQRDPESKTQFKPHPLPAPHEKITAHEVTVDRIQPSWAIDDGVFYFSFSEEGLIAAIEQAGAKDSLADNEAFAAMRKKLGQNAFSSFDFINLPAASTELYRIAQRDLQQTPIPGFTLPALATIRSTLSPVLSVSWSDADGYHAKSSAPFPNADYLRPSEYLWLRTALTIQARRQGAATSTAPAGLP